ncbi:septal ring factor EnvC (AmiA/AmiB activator) [Peptoniphilus olsenii]|uniref:Septal ring factor EnvC (AmiA/AmiB activator) n=1 Tax=Peptoniphilus olsenii TaxID=411570 RepID=A0ABV2J7K6_9FIRM
MKLYELTEMYQNLMDLDIEDEDLHIALSNIDDEIEVKADNIAKLLRDFDKEINGIKDEEKRLYNRRKALENRQKDIKEYLQSSMIALNKRKFKTKLFSFNIQKNAPSLKIIDETKIPEDYFKIEKKLLKSDVKEAVKNGLLTGAVELVQSESLRIR